MVILSEPALVLPVLERVPFDDLVGEILVALRRRNWQVPGVAVQFLTSADGTYRFIRSIRGEDFRIGFACPDTGAIVRSTVITEVVIPGKHLLVQQGRTLYLSVYTGDTWGKDAAAFFGTWYGGRRLRAVYAGQLASGAKFVLEPRQSREAQMGKLVQSYTMNVIFTEFRHWLRERILRLIQGASVTDRPLDFEDGASQSVPKGLECALALGTAQEANRVRQGRQILTTPSALPGGDWIFEVENGGRKSLYENLRPALSGPVLPTTDPRALYLPPSLVRKGWCYVFRLKLKRANGIFVRELDESWRSCPLADYDGSYRHPVLLLGRSLEDDEVELVSGPWPHYDLLRRIRSHPELRQLFGELLGVKDGTHELNEQLRLLSDYLAQDEEMRLAARACSPQFQQGLDVATWYELVSAWRHAQAYGLLE